MNIKFDDLKRTCKECKGIFLYHELEDGRCKGCQYEHEAKQDAKTDDD